MADRMTAQLAVDAISNAITLRRPAGTIVHSNRGTHPLRLAAPLTSRHPSKGTSRPVVLAVAVTQAPSPVAATRLRDARLAADPRTTELCRQALRDRVSRPGKSHVPELRRAEWRPRRVQKQVCIRRCLLSAPGRSAIAIAGPKSLYPRVLRPPHARLAVSASGRSRRRSVDEQLAVIRGRPRAVEPRESPRTLP